MKRILLTNENYETDEFYIIIGEREEIQQEFARLWEESGKDYIVDWYPRYSDYPKFSRDKEYGIMLYNSHFSIITADDAVLEMTSSEIIKIDEY